MPDDSRTSAGRIQIDRLPDPRFGTFSVKTTARTGPFSGLVTDDNTDDYIIWSGLAEMGSFHSFVIFGPSFAHLDHYRVQPEIDSSKVFLVARSFAENDDGIVVPLSGNISIPITEAYKEDITGAASGSARFRSSKPLLWMPYGPDTESGRFFPYSRVFGDLQEGWTFLDEFNEGEPVEILDPYRYFNLLPSAADLQLSAAIMFTLYDSTGTFKRGQTILWLWLSQPFVLSEDFHKRVFTGLDDDGDALDSELTDEPVWWSAYAVDADGVPINWVLWLSELTSDTEQPSWWYDVPGNGDFQEFVEVRTQLYPLFQVDSEWNSLIRVRDWQVDDGFNCVRLQLTDIHVFAAGLTTYDLRVSIEGGVLLRADGGGTLGNITQRLVSAEAEPPRVSNLEGPRRFYRGIPWDENLDQIFIPRTGDTRFDAQPLLTPDHQVVPVVGFHPFRYSADSCKTDRPDFTHFVESGTFDEEVRWLYCRLGAVIDSPFDNPNLRMYILELPYLNGDEHIWVETIQRIYHEKSRTRIEDFSYLKGAMWNSASHHPPIPDPGADEPRDKYLKFWGTVDDMSQYGLAVGDGILLLCNSTHASVRGRSNDWMIPVHLNDFRSFSFLDSRFDVDSVTGEFYVNLTDGDLTVRGSWFVSEGIYLFRVHPIPFSGFESPATIEAWLLYTGLSESDADDLVAEDLEVCIYRMSPSNYEEPPSDTKILLGCAVFNAWTKTINEYIDIPDFADTWFNGDNYFFGGIVVNNVGGVDRVYEAKQDHTASTTNEPGVGANWTTFWEDISDLYSTWVVHFYLSDSFDVEDLTPDVGVGNFFYIFESSLVPESSATPPSPEGAAIACSLQSRSDLALPHNATGDSDRRAGQVLRFPYITGDLQADDLG